MSFEIKWCPKETCDGISLVDRTGFFGLDNPWGYNVPNPQVPTLDVDGVFGFSSYGLELFFAKPGGYDPEATPDFTANLLTWPHTVDPVTGYVTWNFTFEQLGLSSLRSGLWLFRANPAIFNDGASDLNYSRDFEVGFDKDISAKVDASMLAADFDCSCAEGCIKIEDIFLRLMAAKRMGCNCQKPDRFQKMIDWLYNNYKRCC